MWSWTTSKFRPLHAQRNTFIQNNVESNHKQRMPVTREPRSTEHSLSKLVESNHNQRTPFTSSTRPKEHSHSKQCGVEPQAAHTRHEQHTKPNGALSFKIMWSWTTISERPSRAVYAQWSTLIRILWIRTTINARYSQAAHAQRNTLIQNNVESNHKQRKPFTTSTCP